MKKQLSIIKTMLVIASVLTILEIIFLIIEFDQKHIILSCVVFCCFFILLALHFICLKEVKRMIFEGKHENYFFKVIEFDDYQIVRTLLNEKPLENTEEENQLLEEYKKVTVDFTRLHYHYLILKGEEAIGIFYSHSLNKMVNIEFKNSFNEIDNVKNIIVDISKEKGLQVEFK